jgi:putative membrane protein
MNCAIMDATATHASGAPQSYCGPAPGPAELLLRWNADPVLLAVLAIGLGLALRHLSSGPGQRGRTVGILALLFFLYVSPFCAWGSSLFAVRVAHHLLLALVVAPLIARWQPGPLDKVPGGLVAWTALTIVAMWAWHAPRLYAWAVGTHSGYWLMQASILLTATLYWKRLMSSSRPAAIASLLAAMVAMGLLGALITLSSVPLYAAHFATTAPWGLTPLEDQQIGGLIMWAPASAVYLVAALSMVRDLVGREARA